MAAGIVYGTLNFIYDKLWGSKAPSLLEQVVDRGCDIIDKRSLQVVDLLEATAEKFFNVSNNPEKESTSLMGRSIDTIYQISNRGIDAVEGTSLYLVDVIDRFATGVLRQTDARSTDLVQLCRDRSSDFIQLCSVRSGQLVRTVEMSVACCLTQGLRITTQWHETLLNMTNQWNRALLGTLFTGLYLGISLHVGISSESFPYRGDFFSFLQYGLTNGLQILCGGGAICLLTLTLTHKRPRAIAQDVRPEIDQLHNAVQTSRCTHILNRLTTHIVGQSFALERVAQELAQISGEENRALLFAGPKEVGKSQSVSAVAQIKNNRVITLRMNEFASEKSVDDLFGPPEACIPLDIKPRLALELDRYSDNSSWLGATCTVQNVIIHFDHCEQAHSDVLGSLAMLFTKGEWRFRLTDQNGASFTDMTYRLKSSLMICTSNLYQETIVDACERKLNIAQIKKAVEGENTRLPQPLLKSMALIPFGAIPRGVDGYQKLLGDKLDSFVHELQGLNFREVEVQNRSILLENLEAKLYGNRGGVQQIENYFDAVKRVIYQARWGDLGTKKLVVKAEQEGARIFLELFHFGKLTGRYGFYGREDLS